MDFIESASAFNHFIAGTTSPHHFLSTTHPPLSSTRPASSTTILKNSMIALLPTLATSLEESITFSSTIGHHLVACLITLRMRQLCYTLKGVILWTIMPDQMKQSLSRDSQRGMDMVLQQTSGSPTALMV